MQLISILLDEDITVNGKLPDGLVFVKLGENNNTQPHIFMSLGNNTFSDKGISYGTTTYAEYVREHYIIADEDEIRKFLEKQEKKILGLMYAELILRYNE